jgi:hypothetical protein
MTKLITTILFILAVSIITAQTNNKTFHVGNVISDTTTCKDNVYTPDFPSILKSNNKIEIRFITLPSFEDPSFIILTYNKEWNAKYYYYKKGTKSLLSKDLSNKVNLDTLFARLVINNLFSLPDQDSVKTVNYSYHPETNEFIDLRFDVVDGVGYTIEFKIGNHYRRYGFDNPDDYADFYPQVYELRNFANIVEIFNECLKE